MFGYLSTSPSRSGFARAAYKRLMQEYKELTVNPPEGITAGPISEDNFFEWEALIMGPPGTDYEGTHAHAREEEISLVGWLASDMMVCL